MQAEKILFCREFQKQLRKVAGLKTAQASVSTSDATSTTWDKQTSANFSTSSKYVSLSHELWTFFEQSAHRYFKPFWIKELHSLNGPLIWLQSGKFNWFIKLRSHTRDPQMRDPERKSIKLCNFCLSLAKNRFWMKEKVSYLCKWRKSFILKFIFMFCCTFIHKMFLVAWRKPPEPVWARRILIHLHLASSPPSFAHWSPIYSSSLVRCFVLHVFAMSCGVSQNSLFLYLKNTFSNQIKEDL